MLETVEPGPEMMFVDDYENAISVPQVKFQPAVFACTWTKRDLLFTQCIQELRGKATTVAHAHTRSYHDLEDRGRAVEWLHELVLQDPSQKIFHQCALLSSERINSAIDEVFGLTT